MSVSYNSVKINDQTIGISSCSRLAKTQKSTSTRYISFCFIINQFFHIEFDAYEIEFQYNADKHYTHKLTKTTA